ncbi:MAG: hypothetical protein HYY11_06225 [Candidatus Methylomirabilis oxyfera]|nr:hypothetical protein [Candidatus Methylomirabilis oxyfera]
MKSFRGKVIAAMVAVAPALAAGMASANTELVPAARLVAPYWDISGDRSTLMFIANVSPRANLVKGTSAADLNGICNLGGLGGVAGGFAQPGSNCAVHLEFYDKTCDSVDLTIDLSRQDIDQLDLLTDTDLGGVRGLVSKQGWLDVDVRRAITGSGHGNTSVQANVLLGTVLISDSGSDFAIAYPMASSIGSAPNGIGGDIVSRTPNGNANVWFGSFEVFPARVFVPMFFAEGSNHGVAFSSTLAIAGPASGNNGEEAPGQTLEDIPSTVLNEGILVEATVDVVDACENVQSDDFDAHYLIGTLDELLTAQVTTPYNTTCTYPAADVDRTGATPANAFAGGFLDITNHARANLTTAGLIIQDPAIGPLGLERGLVGVLVQNTPSRGDATRLWGDCSFGLVGLGLELSADVGCRFPFTLVDFASHRDIQQNPAPLSQ